MKKALPLILILALLCPCGVFRAHAENPRFDPKLSYQTKLAEITQVKKAIEEISFRVDRGEEIKDTTVVLASASFIISVVAGIWILRSAGSHGEAGCLRFLVGLGIMGTGGAASIAGGYFYWTLHHEEVQALLRQLELREQELKYKQEALDFYIEEHPELSQASQLRSAQSIYDDEINKSFELERSVEDLSLRVKNGEDVSARTAVVGGLALFVSVVAGRWVWRMQSRGSLTFAGNIAALGVGTLTFAGEGIYWCFNSSEIKKLKAQLQTRRAELEHKKAAIEFYLDKKTGPQG